MMATFHRHWLFDAGTLAFAVTRKVLAATVIRPLVQAVLEAVDLTALVKEHLDVDELAASLDVDAIFARVDLDAIVVRIDLAGLMRQAIDTLDLPQLVRDSTGTVASETVQGIRAECARADDAVDRVVGRVLRRRPVPP